MSVTGISGSASAHRSGQATRAELAVLAASKALRLQREQADATIGLIEQAGAGDGKGRHISVRA